MAGPFAVSKYDPFARLLHWLIVLLLSAQYVVGGRCRISTAVRIPSG